MPVQEDKWRAFWETVYLLSIPGMRESIIEGLKTPLEECVERNVDEAEDLAE